MRKLQKAWMPWTAADQFPSEAEFQTHLKQRLHVFDVLRKVMLVLASVCLIAGYVVDRRPIMLVTVFPLAVTLLLTMMESKTEAAINNETQS